MKHFSFDSIRPKYVLFIVNNESCYLIDGLPAEIRYLINISAGVSVVDIIQYRKKQIIWNKQIQSERSISYATSWNTVAMIFCVLNVYLQTIISLAYLLILNAKSWVTEGKISPDCPQYSKTRPISTYLILSANTLCQYNAAWPILFELILYSILDRYNYV